MEVTKRISSLPERLRQVLRIEGEHIFKDSCEWEVGGKAVHARNQVDNVLKIKG
jgi:hypothetical protein